MKKRMGAVKNVKLFLATIAVVFGLVFAAAAPSAYAVPGDLLQLVTLPVPSPSGVGIGIDYDGTNILYTNTGTPIVYKTDLTGANLGSVALINPDGTPLVSDINAIAFNFNDGFLYGGGEVQDLYKIDMTTGVTTLVKPNAIPGPDYYIDVDGLAWDPTDNTFWMSADVQCDVYHLDVSGNMIAGGFNGCAQGLPGNSGLAVGLDGTLWYGTNGSGDIYSLDTSTSPPTNLGVFASPGGRDEDMVCGPSYTKADGSIVDTLLSKDAYNDTFAVIEVAAGSCVSPAEGVPEPSSLILLGAGLAGLGFFRFRKKERKA